MKVAFWHLAAEPLGGFSPNVVESLFFRREWIANANIALATFSHTP
jgi:hypothetical protein